MGTTNKEPRQDAEKETLRTLPTDDIRQIMWRYTDRFDIQMVVQAARSVARGPVARLVAGGARNTHAWTEEKAALFDVYDQSGITGVFLEPHQGGLIEGPKNLALSLAAYELAWVDGGAATCSLATNLALAPIAEKGTQEQKDHYMSAAAPPLAGEDRKPRRGAFALTEPLPYVGVETSLLGGRVRVVEWEEGKEPMLQVEKRGRFITNMAFADFVTAAVSSDDERIKGSCMIILEEEDPGTFDRGSVTQKLVHQLSSTQDPVFNLTVPASRIVGGYTVKAGKIIPRYSHGEVIEAVFSRTRVPVGLMTSAKLLSAVEPIIRYQRNRFRGATGGTEGSPRYELGLQQKEDALHRLIDVWAAGEAGASLGFATSRLFDENDPSIQAKEQYMEEKGLSAGRAQMKELAKREDDVLAFIEASALEEPDKDPRYRELKEDPIVQYILGQALEGVLAPAVKLWNTGTGVDMMRHAVSLMGGYGITEDCPGFLGQKWMDAQLEATYEGPEAVQRRHLSVTMTNRVFLAQFKAWINEMRKIAAERPGTGACALGTSMQLWYHTLHYLRTATDADGSKLHSGTRQGVSFSMADALAWLLSARALILDVIELETKGAENPVVAEGLEGTVSFFTDLCHVQTARSVGEVSRICSELVFGYQRHPSWDNKDDCNCCYTDTEIDSMEAIVPGIGAGARDYSDVLEGSQHASKAGPCVSLKGFETFVRLRSRVDSCVTGCRLAKDRAAQALTKVMIPETLDYPQ